MAQVELCIEFRLGRAQWRGSPDGIIWTPWSALHSPDQKIRAPGLKFAQARVEINGQWHTSKIETWPE